MMAAMNGCDLLVFTGTVGERSSVIRKRIVAHLEFAEFIIDGTANVACVSPDEVTFISQTARSRPIAVVPTNESLEIAKQVRSMLTNKILQVVVLSDQFVAGREVHDNIGSQHG